MAFYFFTEPSKLQNQINGQAFGAIDENNYRLGNMFTANPSETPKAFAVTNGSVLVQQIGTTDKYSIILKPSEQPDLGLPKIDFIIYKGIKKDSIIDGEKVANPNVAASNNDLTRIIHESSQLWYEAEGVLMPSTEPAANTSLGLAYNPSTTETVYQKQDTDLLNDVFFVDNDVNLPFVNSGNHIGNFDTTGDFGIIIIFEKIGYQPAFKLARELDSKLTYTALTTTASNSDIFELKHKKEQILAYLDSSAFFGAFSNLGLQVFNGNEFVERTGDTLYTDVISKHFNSNKIYLDIRNEYDDSFNYYENYDNTIRWNLDNTDTLTDVDYYRNYEWPILIINDESASSEFGSSNTDKSILLSFPSGDNEFPLIYYKRAFLEEIGLTPLETKDIFFVPTIIEEKVTSRKIIVPKSGGRAFANYFQIDFLKSNETSQNQGLSLIKNTYLDNIFPLFTMDIPFDESSGKSYLKVYYDVGYVDKKRINGANYTSNLGIAKDNQLVTFISYPAKYNLNIKQSIDDKLPLSGMEGASNNLFLNDFDALIGSIKLIKQKFVIGGAVKEYLKFQIQEEGLNNEAEKYTFEDVSILAMTVQQYQDLELLNQTEFDAAFKTYLAIDDVNTGVDDNGFPYTQFKYVLRGLKINDSGDIVAHQAEPDTDLIVFTDRKIESVVYERNYEEAIGAEIFSGITKNEDYFINLQTPIKEIITSFETELNNLDLISTLLSSQIASLVRQKSRALWDAAVEYVQSNPNSPDDRPLYWARLKMAVIIKKHPYFLGDIREGSQIALGTDLEKIITIMEEESRNYTKVDFSGAPAGAKKILITGFDPFQLNLDVGTQNPSGMAALQLHGKTITDTFGNEAYIQAAIFPVRYPDFDKNVVERLVSTYLENNSVNMIMSLSLNGGASYFDLERFAGKKRGGFEDNLNIGNGSTSFNQLDSGNEFYETTLPVENIITSSVTDNFNINTQKIFYDQSYVAENGNQRPHIKTDSNQPNANINGFPFSEITENSVEGSGSNYLSNEIFYRIARKRENTGSIVKTGHYHIANQNTTGWNLVSVLQEVEDAIIRSLSGL